MKFRVNDQVVVIAGKDKGKTSNIEKIIYDKKDTNNTKVLLSGVNVVKKHVKPSKDNKGGIVEINKPIHISNIMIVCPQTKKRTRVSFDGSGSKKIRVSQKSKKEIVFS